MPRRGRRVDDAGRDRLAQELLHDAERREALRWGALAGGGLLAGFLAARAIGRAGAASGDGIGGTTISNTDIDAKRIASVRIATEFALSKHAGTDADPWPGSAIQAALDDLPASGGIAFVPPGIYDASAPLGITKSNVSLIGPGPSAKLKTDGLQFIDNESGMIQVSGSMTGVTVERLLLDGTNTDTCRGVLVTGGAEALISECEIVNFLGTLSQRGRGISIHQNPSSPPFKECVVSNCVLRGNQIGIVVHRTRFSMLGSRCVSNVWDGIYIDGIEAQGAVVGNIVSGNSRSGLLAVAGQRVSVSNNSFFENPKNIEINNSGRMTVVGNILDTATSAGGIYLVNTNAKFNMILGNWIWGQRTSSDSHGIYLYNGPMQNVIKGNVCSEVNRNGIALIGAANPTSDNVVEGNLCFNNGLIGSGYAGILLSSAFDNVVRGNRCFDDQASKTQSYGVAESGGADRNTIVENDVRGNATAGLLTSGANTVVRRNIGYLTESRGIVTIPSGATSVSVAHGLVKAPSFVTLGPRHAETSVAYVSARDATTFTIAVPAAVGGDRQIDWYAEA